MTSAPALHTLFSASVHAWRDRPAVNEPGGVSLTYGELDALSIRVRDHLIENGVRPGDRVGIYLPKSIDALAALLGTLRAGAAYVPVDSGSPARRAALILDDCSVRALVVERRLLAGLNDVGAPSAATVVVPLDEVGGGRGLALALPGFLPETQHLDAEPGLDTLAYILYTSGSTGRPKGVMVSHRAALSFVDWCSGVFGPTASDRFSSHAPFHFDLSILDLFLCLKHGARVTLIGEELGKEPHRLAQVVSSEQLTIWYSTPSILSLLAKYGRLEQYDFQALRHVLFAGEVFPIPALRALTTILPQPRYFNLYGPTETNVCTWHEARLPIPAARVEPLPIGRPCDHYRALVADPDGKPVGRGEVGELLIAGPGLMTGYWNLPDQDGQRFLRDAEGMRWYRTGDLVLESAEGDFVFHGRRDRMVKRRGYRIELGEIEAGLAVHPAVREVAVVARADAVSGVRITAVIATADGRRLSLIELKRFCAASLPAYMVPDEFVFRSALPRTSTDKIDYQDLTTMT